MLLYFLAIFFIASTYGYTEELRWADSYTVKGSRISLTSNIVEDYTAWKTHQLSRVDYNNGAVKMITNLGEEMPTRYRIHPETTEEEFNKIVCHFDYYILFDDEPELEEILPSVTENEEYEAVGNETIHDVFTTKFEFVEIEDKKETRNTIWAAYNEIIGWIPVRYEKKKYNVVLGSLVTHEIYNFFGYNTNNIDNDIFDVEKYGCEEISSYDDKILKELMFIDPDNDKHVDNVFSHFKNKYNRNYAHEKEHELRKSIFEENIRLITAANRRNQTYKLGINQFSDWTPEELEMSLGAIPRPENSHATTTFPYTENEVNDIVEKLPQEFDLRLFGVISPVKNQEKCGSCWTFAAAAVTESGWARVNGGRVLGLSNQAIVDCAYEGLGDKGAGGCNGGFDYCAYNFIMKHGLPTDEEYGPYKSQDGFCNIRNMTKTYFIKGFTDVTHYNHKAMKVATVNHGPLFIYVRVSKAFFAYSSGIFYQTNEDCNPEAPNHAVVLVGYGERYGELFWILKNSWGDKWGMDGYMLIAAKDDVCGVSAHPSYPVF